jgi:tellurite resistance protein
MRLRFTPGFWAFTFSWCAVALLALHWLVLTHRAGQRVMAWLVCGAVTVLVGAIAVRTAVALARRDLVAPCAAAEDGAQDPRSAPNRALERC